MSHPAIYTTPSGNMIGKVTRDNIGMVAERINEVLEGHTYTFVAVNEMFGFRPEVRTGQQLEGEKTTSGEAVHLHWDDDWAHITVSDTYGSWGVSTSSERFPVEIDICYKYGWQILIRHKASAGNWIWWCIAVEDDDR